MHWYLLDFGPTARQSVNENIYYCYAYMTKQLINFNWMCELVLETFLKAIITVTVTARGARKLWRHRFVSIWNALNRQPNRKCQHMTVCAADNHMRFFQLVGMQSFTRYFT